MKSSILKLKAQTPSQRAQFALDALEEAEKSPLYVVKMNIYHDYTEAEGKCFACLGGLAAIKAIQGDFQSIFPVVTQSGIYNRLDYETASYIIEFEDSINSLRMGSIDLFFDYMGLDYSAGALFNRDVAGYYSDPLKFKEDIKEITKHLQSEGY
jgi:hypothetical protein